MLVFTRASGIPCHHQWEHPGRVRVRTCHSSGSGRRLYRCTLPSISRRRASLRPVVGGCASTTLCSSTAIGARIPSAHAPVTRRGPEDQQLHRYHIPVVIHPGPWGNAGLGSDGGQSVWRFVGFSVEIGVAVFPTPFFPWPPKAANHRGRCLSTPLS